jgi:hypothetical protein
LVEACLIGHGKPRMISVASGDGLVTLSDT